VAWAAVVDRTQHPDDTNEGREQCALYGQWCAVCMKCSTDLREADFVWDQVDGILAEGNAKGECWCTNTAECATSKYERDKAPPKESAKAMPK
jgi:hypothetical protein